jgi:ABC-type phosphate transport system substrate-binding protein
MNTTAKNLAIGLGIFAIEIAFDALTIAVNPQNDWAKDITIAELKKCGNLRLKEKSSAGIKCVLLGPIDHSR